ncbi:MAG: alanine/glycine:cation symporter family protein [Bacteroidales bacterium]|nr:alanine/glycine:cation symporter family protein [Bacteroidales bacterium]MDY0253349.1 alanine/glycine:cation symporter family protein [Tenuifilaceae bacterium]
MTGIDQRINELFQPVVDALSQVLFWDPIKALGFDIGAAAPIVVLWLMVGGLFFTIRMKFINIRAFGHGVALASGRYRSKQSEGEVSPFQALTTALSATVGLGNIAGVAIAISLGGPGATVWMIMAGFLGMSLKFTECTLGVKYRVIDDKGKVSGGPMYYLRKGLESKGKKRLGVFLAILFAVLVIGASFGGGNMLQVNQAFAQLQYVVPQMEGYGAAFGLVVALLVGLVVVGGIKGIAQVTSRLVPIMAIIYILTSMYIIGVHFSELGTIFKLILRSAFGLEAIGGGFFGALFVGFQRGAFSNEAGIGSSPIAHAAAKTTEPVSEGMVALLEPFVDTMVVCTMTALVIVSTGLYVNPDGLEGAQLTAAAFGSILPWFPYILVLCIFLFAFSTMISWSYYGLKGFNYLFQKPLTRLTGKTRASDLVYYFFFLASIVVGASSSLTAVIDFSDMMILGMAFPNIIGLMYLAPEVSHDLKQYLHKLQPGQNSQQ